MRRHLLRLTRTLGVLALVGAPAMGQGHHRPANRAAVDTAPVSLPVGLPTAAPTVTSTATPASQPVAMPTAPLLAPPVALPVMPAAPAAAAQAAPPGSPSASSDVVPGAVLADSATLIIHNQPIAVFRTGLGVLSAADRAEAARRRVNALADTLAAAPAESARVRAAVSLVHTNDGVVVFADGRGLFTLTPADADTAGGQTLEVAAAGAAKRLKTVLVAEREERSVSYLARAIALAIGATVLFFVVLRTVRLVRRSTLRRLPEVAGPHLTGLTIRSHSLLTASQLLTFIRRLVDVAATVTGLFAAYVWLAFILTRFAYSRPWGEALGAYLTRTIVRLSVSALAAVPGLFTVALIFVVARWLTHLVSGFFDAVQAGRVEQPWLPPETADPTKRIAVVLLWLLAVVVAYPYMPGSGSDVFKGVSVFAGVVLSLGSSGVVNQAMSGLVLMYARALKPGDYVRIGDIEGTVTTLGMLSTKIRTTKREEVTLPNAVVVGASVKNFSCLATRGDGVIVYTSVTIGYDVPWRQVEAMLLLAATRTDGLLTEPRPFVLKTGLSDFYVEYQLNAHLAEAPRRIPVLSALHGHIVDVFNEHEVQILSPHYMADPPTPAVVPPARWYAAPASRTNGQNDDGHGAGQPVARGAMP